MFKEIVINSGYNSVLFNSFMFLMKLDIAAKRGVIIMANVDTSLGYTPSFCDSLSPISIVLAMFDQCRLFRKSKKNLSIEINTHNGIITKTHIMSDNIL